MSSWFIIVPGAVALVAAGALFRAVQRADDGYEDHHGFYRKLGLSPRRPEGATLTPRAAIPTPRHARKLGAGRRRHERAAQTLTAAKD